MGGGGGGGGGGGAGGGGGGGGGGGRVTSYIWPSADVCAEWPNFSVLSGIRLAPLVKTGGKNYQLFSVPLKSKLEQEHYLNLSNLWWITFTAFH